METGDPASDRAKDGGACGRPDELQDDGGVSPLPMICIASALLAIGVTIAISNARGGDTVGGSAGEDTAHNGDVS